MPALFIKLHGRQTLGMFERELSKAYAKSRQATDIVFDLSDVEWIGHLPAMLLYAWATVLRESARSPRVRVDIQERRQLTNQVRKALIDFGILRALREVGVEVPFSAAADPESGLPLTTIAPTVDLRTMFSDLSGHIAQAARITDTSRNIIEDAFGIVMFELGENALIHGGGARAQYEVVVARSSGPTTAGGVVRVFPEGTPYVEICMSDLGPGIEKSLHAAMPADYSPPYESKRGFLKGERIVAFGFEFSSTSDKTKRVARLRQLLNSDTFVPEDIATGLFCVREVARAYNGQFIVRTPDTLLSVDFRGEAHKPVVTGRRDLGIKKLAKLPGTHYLLRLPLTAPKPKDRTTGTTITRKARIADVVSLLEHRGTVEEVLLSAIESVDRHLRDRRHVVGLSIITPTRMRLPSKALGLYSDGNLLTVPPDRVLS